METLYPDRRGYACFPARDLIRLRWPEVEGGWRRTVSRGGRGVKHRRSNGSFVAYVPVPSLSCPRFSILWLCFPCLDHGYPRLDGENLVSEVVEIFTSCRNLFSSLRLFVFFFFLLREMWLRCLDLYLY